MPTRRTVLLVGGASVLVAGAGVTAYARGPGLSRAVAPWSQAGESFGDARIDALAYAILAPNSHNRQPWMFELVGDDRIDVYCDLDRRLPETDPFDRQIAVSFGCMLELLSLGATKTGHSATITPFPDGAPGARLDERRLATVTLVAGANTDDPLADQIAARRSNKQAYDLNRPVDAVALSDLSAPFTGAIRAGGTSDPGEVRNLVDLCKAGWMVEYETDRTRRESINVMRIGNREIVENPDGIELGGTMMGLMKLTGIVSRETLDTPGSSAYEKGIDMYMSLIEATPSFIWLISSGADRETQIASGRAWVRLNLIAQSMGLSVHPLSQVLQEFPEMAPHYARAHTDLGAGDGEVVQMLARLGYGPASARTPRWPVTAKLVQEPA